MARRHHRLKLTLYYKENIMELCSVCNKRHPLGECKERKNKQVSMKTLLMALLIGIVPVLGFNAYAEAETKKVCHDKIDSKTGKPVKKADGSTVQDCKNIKVHKKLEGTEVPTKK